MYKFGDCTVRSAPLAARFHRATQRFYGERKGPGHDPRRPLPPAHPLLSRPSLGAAITAIGAADGRSPARFRSSRRRTAVVERAAALAQLHEVDRQIDGTRLTGQATYGFETDNLTSAPLDVAGSDSTVVSMHAPHALELESQCPRDEGFSSPAAYLVYCISAPPPTWRTATRGRPGASASSSSAGCRGTTRSTTRPSRR